MRGSDVVAFGEERRTVPAGWDAQRQQRLDLRRDKHITATHAVIKRLDPPPAGVIR
jgi:hypothetical protein